MAVAIATDLGKDMGGVPLFDGVAFKLESGDRMTLSGRNGSGKTTLLRMLAGQAGIDRGRLTIQKGAKVALHDQRPPRERDVTLRDYVLSGAGEVTAVERELARLEQAMADGAHDTKTLDAYARSQAALERHGGYNWRERALAVLHGLGFADAQFDRLLDSFSGGELTRAALGRALTGEPELLLLDEPTNHLDIGALEWLEKHLQSIDAAVVLVAHDRWFLESVGTAVLELEHRKARYFSGPWHAWRKERAARELAAGRAVERQQAEIERLERFVERFRAKASKARQAQSRVKRLDKIERTDGPTDAEARLDFEFAAPERSGRVVFELRGGRIEVPGRVLIENAELWLERGEHVALVGANGTGKTTLIQTLTGKRELPAGKLSTGHNVTLGYVSQHAEELGEQGTVLEATQRATGLPPNKARGLLGRFLMSGDDALKPIGGLSGGERRRLSLAILVSSKSNVLVLDEPTNHLDVESREALEDALRDFPGSLLLISHDRALLDAVGTRTVAIEDGELRSHQGGWAEYVAARDAAKEAETVKVAPKGRAKSTKAAAKKVQPKSNGSAPAKSKTAKRAERDLEREIQRAETAMAKLEDELADPGAWATPEQSAKSTKRHTAAKRLIEQLYERLESAA